uniref:Uncharacterized protein n=1 Tax=Glossina palpalis gambiensis TaxID=67801 RepID=A0A1B0B4N3_9MUSC
MIFTSDIAAAIVTDEKVQKLCYCIHCQKKKKGKVKNNSFCNLTQFERNASFNVNLLCTEFMQFAVGVREIAYLKICLTGHDVMSLPTQQERGLFNPFQFYRHQGGQLISHNLSFYSFHVIKRFAASSKCFISEGIHLCASAKMKIII